MNWKQFIPAGIAGFIMLFGVGFFWHVAVEGRFYAEETLVIVRPHIAFPAIVIAELVRGFVMAYLYRIGYKGGSRTGAGARFGLLIGLFSAVFPLFHVGQYDFATGAWYWFEGLFYIVQGVLAGMVIGMVYARLGMKRA
jgi:hypothetical protein